MGICGIYEIECIASNKRLIGSSKHVRRRYGQHLWKLRRGIHNNPHLQNAFNLHGFENFKFSIIEECLHNDLLKREDWWIDAKNTRNREYGYNFKSAERPTLSNEARTALSINRRGKGNPMYGKNLSPDHKRKISRALKNVPRYISEETKKKMSVSQTGKKLSEETKLKIGLASKIRIFSEESKKRMSEAQKLYRATHPKRVLSYETKQKMSLYRKGRKLNMSEEGRKSLSDNMKRRNLLRRKEVQDSSGK
jgi:group I intron endonuclease